MSKIESFVVNKGVVPVNELKGMSSHFASVKDPVVEFLYTIAVAAEAGTLAPIRVLTVAGNL
ncbi:MAG: hypothetical protein EBU30_08810 [Synechococcaceae bacterium WB6_3B_236]|nr:hypothetical protein [Synechococcaceae bacterium WB6_3B_236]